MSRYGISVPYPLHRLNLEVLTWMVYLLTPLKIGERSVQVENRFYLGLPGRGEAALAGVAACDEERARCVRGL